MAPADGNVEIGLHGRNLGCASSLRLGKLLECASSLFRRRYMGCSGLFQLFLDLVLFVDQFPLNPQLLFLEFIGAILLADECPFKPFILRGKGLNGGRIDGNFGENNGGNRYGGAGA